MAAPRNPFPGMNPFLELHWSDVHTRLITYASDALVEDLPPELSVRTEERISIATDSESRSYRADVAVVQPADLPPLSEPPTRGVSQRMPVADPEIVVMEPRTERWLEIRDGDRLVTVIEVLSPANKRDEGRAAYLLKQRDYVLGGVNLVEIDLLRGGRHTVAVDLRSLRPLEGTAYTVCVTRATMTGRREVYRCPLRQRLPVIRIPLRGTDPDVALDLQPLVDRCYSAGRYWLVEQSQTLEPPLPVEEADWAQGLLQRARE